MPPKTSRLRIVSDKVYLDGEYVPFDATPELREQLLCMLVHLLDAEGDWRSGTDIDCAEKRKPSAGLSGTRWDRVRKKLPSNLFALTESDRRKGYRLIPDVWRR